MSLELLARRRVCRWLTSTRSATDVRNRLLLCLGVTQLKILLRRPCLGLRQGLCGWEHEEICARVPLLTCSV